MNKELKVSFYLKRESRLEKNAVGENVIYPIIGKIIIGNSIAQFSTKLKIEERLWHVKSGRATGKSHTAVKLNREINKINLTIHAHYADILKRTGAVTAIEVKNAFQGIASSQKTLLVLFEEVMTDFRARIGIDRAEGTYEQHEILYRQLKLFLREKYNIEDIPLSGLDMPFIEALDYYFRVKRGMKPRTVKARIVLLNKVVRLALHRNYITCPPFVGFDLGKTELPDKSLTSEELDRLISTPLKSSTQSFIRDMFVFSTFTGIAHADMVNLRHDNIHRQEDGSLWITLNRQKTGSVSHIPMLDIPLRIMEKYRNTDFAGRDGKVFKMTTVENMDVQLKKIAKAAGITQRLCYHMSRHSFATSVCLSQGVPIETLSQMMGHQDIATTQIYAEITRTKINEDMSKLAETIQGKYELPENDCKIHKIRRNRRFPERENNEDNI